MFSSQYRLDGAEILVYYDKKKLKVENSVIRSDIENIYLDFEGLKNPAKKFCLNAFYLTDKKEIYNYEASEMSKIWERKLKSVENPLIAVGDLNCNVQTDVYNRVTLNKDH